MSPVAVSPKCPCSVGRLSCETAPNGGSATGVTTRSSRSVPQTPSSVDCSSQRKTSAIAPCSSRTIARSSSHTNAYSIRPDSSVTHHSRPCGSRCSKRRSDLKDFRDCSVLQPHHRAVVEPHKRIQHTARFIGHAPQPALRVAMLEAAFSVRRDGASPPQTIVEVALAKAGGFGAAQLPERIVAVTPAAIGGCESDTASVRIVRVEAIEPDTNDASGFIEGPRFEGLVDSPPDASARVVFEGHRAARATGPFPMREASAIVAAENLRGPVRPFAAHGAAQPIEVYAQVGAVMAGRILDSPAAARFRGLVAPHSLRPFDRAVRRCAQKLAPGFPSDAHAVV